jgi:biopolymer transport protein TolR
MAQLTPAQRQYIRKKTKVHDLDPSEMGGELNIIPFLDIVVNLIMFLLMTTTVVLTITQIDSQLPDYRRGVGGRSPTPEASLNLNLTITDSGVIVTGSGGKLAPGCTTTALGRVVTVPKTVQALVDPLTGRPIQPPRQAMQYDWPGLTQCVARVKEQFPEETQVIISADPLVEYEHLIAAMDAVRFDGTRELFPEVLLSGGVR